jgi:uncharacterized membrane protein
MNRLKQLWSNLRSSFWFMPSLIVVVSIAFAVALIEADSPGATDGWPGGRACLGPGRKARAG